MGRHGTIAGRKDKQDAIRGKLFTKYAKEIIIAAKNGGDPDYNFALKNAIDKAKAINMPNDNITRAIKKGTGEFGGANYESGMYEGYGPGGVAIVVEVLTDNKNRASSSMKHIFDKYGGNLGVQGCVSYMFDRKGFILIEKTDAIDEDQLMETALEAGMEDFITKEDSYEIITSTEDFHPVVEALKNAGYELLENNIEYLPSIENTLEEAHDIKALEKLISMLEENDDVQNVYTNATNELDV